MIGADRMNMFNRGATDTNPYPESIFSKLGERFGFNVDYTNVLGGGDAGRQRIAEINQLRYDQSVNPQNYKPGDFEMYANTSMGPVQKMPATGIQQLLGQIPYLGAIQKIFPRDTLPANDPRMISARQRKKSDTNIFDRFLGR